MDLLNLRDKLDTKFEELNLKFDLMDYLTSLETFEEAFQYIADYSIDTEYADLASFAAKHCDEMEQVIYTQYYGLDAATYDYPAHIRAAEFLYYYNTLYAFKDIFCQFLAAVYLISKGIEEIEEKEFENIKNICNQIEIDDNISTFLTKIDERIVRNENR